MNEQHLKVENCDSSKRPIKYFYNIEDFPKFKILEENYKELLKELLEIVNRENQISFQEEIESDLYNDTTSTKKNTEDSENKTKQNKTFEPWVEKNLYHESNEQGWDVAPLMIGGEKIPDRYEKFPILTSLVEKITGVMSISYSLLKPGTHIVPHKGYDDYSEKMFRFHMGMIVPDGDIGIRVEKEIRKWELAKSFIFDDFMLHEAWNFSCKNRIVLIIDFLKDDNILPKNIIFLDKNFNNSIKNYFNNNNLDQDENKN